MEYRENDNGFTGITIYRSILVCICKLPNNILNLLTHIQLPGHQKIKFLISRIELRCDQKWGCGRRCIPYPPTCVRQDSSTGKVDPYADATYGKPQYWKLH